MADTQSQNYTSRTDSVGVSIITGLTPRDVHDFIKRLVTLNATLKSQLAAANRNIIARRHGSTDNASTEAVEHSPVQVTGQPASYTPASQWQQRYLSTLPGESSGITAVQPESEVADVGQALEEWQERLYAPNADPQLINYGHRELERQQQLYANLLALHHNDWQRHNEQEADFRRELASSIRQKTAALQERDESSARALEVQQRLQNEKDDLKIRYDRDQETLQKLRQDNATLQQQVEYLERAKRQLDDAIEVQLGKIKELEDSHKIEEKRLREQAERIAKLTEQLAKLDELSNDNSALKNDLENAQKEISSLSELKEKFEAVRQSREQAVEEIKRLQQERDSASAKLEQLPCSEQAAKDMEELQKERDSLREKLEQLQSDSKPTSGVEQKKTINQLERRNRELELKLDEMRKSKAILQTMVEDNTSKLAEMELRGQLDDAKAVLKEYEDLTRTRNETIENLKREQSRSIENSEKFKELRIQFNACKSELDEKRQKLESESALLKELQESNARMQSTLDEITKERDDLRLITMRQRHNPPPAPRMSGLVSNPDAERSAAAAATPPAFAQPLRQEIATEAVSPRARVGTRQSAVQTPSSNRLPAWSQPPAYRTGPPTTHRCQYCRAELPDLDSKFVHEKDCPKRPFDD